MKKSDITYQDKLNELRLDISHPNNRGQVFILVEGDTDIRLFRKLFNLNNSNVENIPGGGIKLAECVTELIQIYPLVIGIKDADFSNLNQNAVAADCIFTTDFHDMEMTMLSNDDTFSAIVFEYADIAHNQHANFRETVMRTIESISYLKWLNVAESVELDFNCGFQDLINCANNTIDFNQYLTRILARSPNKTISDANEVIARINQLRNENPNLFQLTNGHDFLKTLSKYFRDIHNNNGTNDTSLASSLRVAYTVTHFQQTTLFQKTNEWSVENGVSIHL